MYIHVHTYAHMYIHVHTHTHMYIHVHTHTHTHTYVLTHTQAHTHARMHTQHTHHNIWLCDIQTHNRITPFNFEETRKVNKDIQRWYMDMCEWVCSVQERRKTRVKIMISTHSYKYTHTHTHARKHKDSHKCIRKCMDTTTNTHMHTNTQDVKGVHTSTAFLYTHTCHYCIASDGVTCFCLPLQCYIIMYHHMHASF